MNKTPPKVSVTVETPPPLPPPPKKVTISIEADGRDLTALARLVGSVLGNGGPRPFFEKLYYALKEAGIDHYHPEVRHAGESICFAPYPGE